MIISHSKKFIFFACGKTGTTSIEAVLKPFHEGDDLLALIYERAADASISRIKHVRPELVKDCIPEEIWQEYFKFVFVRNPWDWVVSQYHFSNFKKRWPDHLNLSGKVHRRHVYKVWNRLRTANPYDPCESLMQHVYVYGRGKEKLPDFVGRFERLQEDFDQICRYLDIPHTRLPAKNRTTHQSYQKLYTFGAKKLVGQLYKADIQLLGYGFDKILDTEHLSRLFPPCEEEDI